MNSTESSQLIISYNICFRDLLENEDDITVVASLFLKITGRTKCLSTYKHHLTIQWWCKKYH